MGKPASPLLLVRAGPSPLRLQRRRRLKVPEFSRAKARRALASALDGQPQKLTTSNNLQMGKS